MAPRMLLTSYYTCDALLRLDRDANSLTDARAQCTALFECATDITTKRPTKDPSKVTAIPVLSEWYAPL